MAAINIEIEVLLTGELTPYRPATYWDPAEGGEVEDLDVVGLQVEVLERVSAGDIVRGALTGDFKQPAWKTVDLLEGVDLKAPAIQRLFSNILDAHRKDAEQAIVDHVLDRAA